MYPLTLLSLISVALIFERSVFWFRTHSPRTRRLVRALAEALRSGDTARARQTAGSSSSVYADFVVGALDRSSAPTASVAVEQIESQRPRIERFASPLAAIYTAAPLLGILGTVTGIIQSFQLFDQASVTTDIQEVAAGIAQALYTTAFGLVIALVTYFPYTVFRTQAERCLARLEMLAGAMEDTAGTRWPSADTTPAP